MDLFLLILLFTLSLFFRLPYLDCDAYGDEAFYYYLSKNPWSCFNTLEAQGRSPLLYFLYSPFSQTLETFRFFNVLVGATIPCLIYLILAKKQVNPLIRISVSLIPTFHYLFVKYSSFVLLDTLGTFFTLASLLFYLNEKDVAYSVSLFLAMMTKEYYVVFAVVMMVAIFIRKKVLHKSTLIALGFFGTFIFFLYMTKSFPTFLIYVHSDNPINIIRFEQMFLSIFLIPALALSFKIENLEFFLISMAYPVFLYFWGNCEEWYLLLPLAINICLIAFALNKFLSEYHTTESSKRFQKTKTLLLFVFMITLIGISAINELQSIPIYIPADHDLTEATSFLKLNYSGQKIALVDCFWATRYYPIGEFMQVECWGWSDQDSFPTEKINQTGLCIIFKIDTFYNEIFQENIRESWIIQFENLKYIIAIKKEVNYST